MSNNSKDSNTLMLMLTISSCKEFKTLPNTVILSTVVSNNLDPNLNLLKLWIYISMKVSRWWTQHVVEVMSLEGLIIVEEIQGLYRSVTAKISVTICSMILIIQLKRHMNSLQNWYGVEVLTLLSLIVSNNSFNLTQLLAFDWEKCVIYIRGLFFPLSKECSCGFWS